MRDGRFARRVFIGAGLYGLAGILPLYVTETLFTELFPPTLSHPEFFYGFAGVALALKYFVFPFVKVLCSCCLFKSFVFLYPVT